MTYINCCRNKVCSFNKGRKTKEYCFDIVTKYLFNIGNYLSHCLHASEISLFGYQLLWMPIVFVQVKSEN